MTVPTIYVLSKNIKNIKFFFLMKFSIFTAEKNLFIAWACFRNEKHLPLGGMYDFLPQ